MKNARSTLTTVDEVIDAFGGPTEAARWAGLGKSAVSNWKARGFISPGWHYRMSKWAASHGYELSPKVFGEDDDDQRPKARALPPPAYA